MIDNGQHAPEHVVRSLASMLSLEHYFSPVLTLEQSHLALLAHARRTADTIWREAHLNGQVYAASMKPPAPMFMCNPCPHKAQVLAAFEERDRGRDADA